MVRYWDSVHDIEWSWEKVSAGFWQRYPNPFSKHVLTEDVISRHVDKETGCLHTVRLISKTNKVPSWMAKWIGNGATSLLVEESVVDLKHREMTTITKNVTLTKFMCVEQRVVYKEHPQQNDWTQQSVDSDIRSDMYIGAMVERAGVQRLAGNTKKALDGFKFVLAGLNGDSPKTFRTSLQAPQLKEGLETLKRGTEALKSKPAYCDSKP